MIHFKNFQALQRFFLKKGLTCGNVRPLRTTLLIHVMLHAIRAETGALIREWGYSYFLALSDQSLLKSVVIRVDFKRIRRTGHEYAPQLTLYFRPCMHILSIGYNLFQS